MPYRNSLRAGPPKLDKAPARSGQTSKRNARTSTRATKGRNNGERADNGDAHEPTGLTSDEGSDADSSEASGDESDEGSESELSESPSADEDEGESDAFEPSASEQEVEEDIESVASEDLDATPKAGRKRGAGAKAAPAKKKRRKAAEEEDEEDDEDDDEIELAPGQKIVARIKIYPAPKADPGESYSQLLYGSF